MKPTSYPIGVSRRSTGLSPAHKELIKLLAQIAVEDYLRETEAAEAKEATS